MRTFSKGFWLATGLASGLAAYSFMWCVAIPQIIGKAPYWDSSLANAVVYIVIWPMLLLQSLPIPEWFAYMPAGQIILFLLFCTSGILLGPVLFLFVWTAGCLWFARKCGGIEQKRTANKASHATSESAPGADSSAHQG